MARFDQVAAAREQAPGGIAHEFGELHRLLVERVQDYAIFALDPGGFILSWNAGAERFKGYTTDEIIGRHFSIFYPREKVSVGWPEHELREAARVGRFEDEGWRVRKDGTRFWANVVITALRSETGELIGYAKVTRDLTERRASEDALRLSEERFRLLVTSVKDYAIFMLDPEGRVATWNEGAQRAKGYSEEEIIGRHFSIFYPPDRVAEHFPEYELAEATRVGRFEDEGWRVRKDGSRFWANVVITPLYATAGRLVGFGKVTRDLTERRAAEKRAIQDARRVAAEEAARHTADVARQRSEQLQALTSALAAVHAIPDIARVVFTQAFPAAGADGGSIGVIAPDGNHLRIIVESGYDGLTDEFRLVSLDAPMPMPTAVRTGTTVVCRTQGERDARFPATSVLLASFESSVVVPLASGGHPIGAIAMHRRPRPGEALTSDAVTFMESVAQQCGQALERAELYESERLARREAEDARARAEEANRAKSQFLAAMSHELRTPLNAIGGYAQLIELGLSGEVSEQQRTQLGRIQRSQQHLLGIINDILNFARVDAGQVIYEVTDVPMQDVLQSATQMILPQANEKGIALGVTTCAVDVVARADPSKVEQIVLNLLTNAVKFTTPQGRVRITCQRDGRGRVACAVSDTGIGIPPDQLDRVFEPFIQVGRSLTTNQEGTGLGLAISRDLARAMQGDIEVQSVPDQGSVFTLLLPAADSGSISD